MKALNYLKEVKNEFGNVTWPSRKQTITHTSLVIAISLGVAVYLGLFDVLFTYLLDMFVLS